ncbi:MAG: hypothetical protein IJM23_08075 [Lachnospiraceae bacterium]|nr:hypothetical protein [Lachnospiraceae bacterium]
MGMIKCPVCGKDISDRVGRCLYCDSVVDIKSYDSQSKQAEFNNNSYRSNREATKSERVIENNTFNGNIHADNARNMRNNHQRQTAERNPASKKKISCGAKVAIIVLVIVLICALGLGACSIMLVAIGSMNKNDSSKNNETINKKVSEASGDEMPDELAGFYLGDDGSGLSIFEDGNCIFYYTYMGTTKKYNDLISGYLNGRITIGIPEYGYCIYADYNDKSFNGVLDFKSQTTEWNEENFYKSGPPKDLSEAEFLTQHNSFDPKQYNYDGAVEGNNGEIDNKLNENKESKEIKIGGIMLRVPGYVSEGTIDGESEYIYGDDNVTLIIEAQDITAKLSDQQFESLGNQIIEKSMDSMPEKLRSYYEKNSIELFYTKQKIPYFFIEADNGDIYGVISVLYNSRDSKILVLRFFCDDYAKTEDFKNMLYEVKRISDQADIYEDMYEDNGDGVEIKESDSNGVDPDLKAFLDSYESFMDEYVEFMQKYKSGGSSLDMMTEYLDMMNKYQDFAEKAEKYDTDSMSDADSKYYFEVMNRINAKILQMAY